MADPTRRSLLDELFKQNGQTLSALQERLPMTRFGVMKHLRVLEEAGLVTSRRQGREKFHFLNTVPIRLVHDRWVSKYAEPWAATLSGLKTYLEDDAMGEIRTVSWADGTAPVAAGTAVFEVFIKTTPDRLWEAITDPEQRKLYSFGVETHSAWTPGSKYMASVPGAVDIASGTNIEVDPPRLLVQTFDALWSDEVKAQGTTRVTWEIEPVGTSCRLTVTHDQLPADANPELYGGWPMILSGLKTLLETGELLDTPGSLQYSETPALAGMADRRARAKKEDYEMDTKAAGPITGVHTVGVPVTDQDRAVEFYVNGLGFEKRVDFPLEQFGGRWIEVAPHGAAVTIALVPERDGVPSGIETGIRLTTADADAVHQELQRRGVEVGELLRWPEAPAMFAIHDQDGNGLEIVEL